MTMRRGLETFRAQGFEFEFFEEETALPAARLDEFDLVVLARANIVNGANSRPWLKSDAEHGLVEFVKHGCGLLVIHAGTSRYESLPALNALIGGAFIRHPDLCTVTVEPMAGHPLTRDVNAFSVPDEHYFVRLDDRCADVFLRSNSMHGGQPAGWTRSDGAGRVCVLTPGHNVEVWLHPEFQKLLLNALRWTAKMN